MHLTDYEKALLNGEHGEARRLAMPVLYDLGEYYKVDRFVEIVACHDDSTVFLGEAHVEFAEHLVGMGARFAVPNNTNATAIDMSRFDRQKHDVKLMTATRRIEAAHMALGDIVGDKVWAMDGFPPHISVDNLKNMSATLASSGGIALFQLVGITPEAQTLEMAFQGEKPREVVTLGCKDIRKAEAQLNHLGANEKIDLIALGCPHFSCAEFLKLEDALKGRKVHGNCMLWVFTNRSTYSMIQDSGQLHRLSSQGVEIFVDGCPLQHPVEKWKTNTFMSNSGKFCTYCFGLTGKHPGLGTIAECAESAVAGKVWQERKPWWK